MHQWQIEHGYIPCRVLKNISYGQLGVTNSFESDYMLHGNTLFNADEGELARSFASLPNRCGKKQRRAYQLVRQRHTYLNRWEFLMTAFKLCRDFTPEASYCMNGTELKVVHLSCHAGCIRHLDYVASRVGWNIDHMNMLTLEGCDSYNMTKKRADVMWVKYRDRIMNSDVVISSDTLPPCRA